MNEDQESGRARTEVIAEPTDVSWTAVLQAKTAFVRIDCDPIPIRIGRCGNPSRQLFLGEEDQGQLKIGQGAAVEGRILATRTHNSCTHVSSRKSNPTTKQE